MFPACSPGAALHVAEVGEQGGALMLRVLALQAHLRAEHRVAARGIEEITGAMGAWLTPSTVISTVAPSRSSATRPAFAPWCVRAPQRRCVLEQHEVELFPLDLIGVRPGRVEATIEAEDVVAALVVRREVGAEFLYTDSLQGVRRGRGAR